ncbi:MAG: hypothetical protein Q7V53_07165, partial [Caldisericota bacterium]|nr:hypothetical protein [Caldisericota bacterium]
MKTTLLKLDRTLFEVSGNEWTDSRGEVARALGKALTWSEVLQNKCSVLVGSANSGKTSELRLQARALREEHVHACFISVRELLVGGVVEDALERNESAALNAWSSTPHQQLFLFVDSIDEATLSGARDLGRCLGKLVERVAVAQENVTWVLSTRPAVLNQDVLDAIDDSLGVKVSRRAAQENKSESILDAAESTA